MDDIYAPTLEPPPTRTINQPSGVMENPENKKPTPKIGSHFIDFIQTLVVFGAIFATLYLFVAQPHKVSGSSMVPNFHNADYILTDKVSYRFGNPKNSDIVVLKNPRNQSQDFIKRIIAIPGDTLRVEGNQIYVNDRPLQENYLPPNTTTSDGAFIRDGQTLKAGPDQYFVMGDNRSHSSDSREWGPVTKKQIIGKVFFRYWPPGGFGLI